MKHISVTKTSIQNIIGLFMQSRIVVATIIKNRRNPDFMSHTCRVSMNDTMFHFVQC